MPTDLLPYIFTLLTAGVLLRVGKWYAEKLAVQLSEHTQRLDKLWEAVYNDQDHTNRMQANVNQAQAVINQDIEERLRTEERRD